MVDHKNIILASSSPRRRYLLRQAGIRFQVVRNKVDEDESMLTQGNPELLALRLAEQKASEVARKNRGSIVLGADTVVVAEGNILCKPKDKKDAWKMLKILSGRWHDVVTGVAVIKGDQVVSGVERTRVKFRSLSRKDIADYIASGEPMDKAGAYAVQGLASSFVDQMKGDYTNVVGLPLNLTVSLLSSIQKRTLR